MKLHGMWLVVAAVVLTVVAGLQAEVKTVVEQNAGDAATAEFKFKSVPAPSKTDAAARAKFAVVAGEADPNGAGVEAINDGQLPSEADQPTHNFFFTAGSTGGRLAVDLGEAIEVRQVNTYSWHTDTRGPQVYKLYAADGSGDGFDARPGEDTDPEKHGWKLLASVDTRPKDGEAGGQYGVSVSDSGGALGKYRYLLLDISATESDDPFGNTFYSEIDVVSDAAGTTAPAESSATKKAPGESKYEIEIDYSELPELKDWIETRLRPALETWYPKIVELLPSEGYSAPRKFTVTFRKEGGGVAATGGTHITCDGPWFKANLDGEAVGAVVHELVHVAQQYRGRGSRRNPGWLVEGVADYIRWFKFEPAKVRPRPNPNRAKYTDSYRTTAAFLEYVAANKDHEIVVKFNAAMREGRYRPELWKEYTGQTVDELWADYIAYLKGDK